MAGAQPAAVVVGVSASQGLGAAVARRCAQGGLPVFIAGRTAERLQTVQQEITENGGVAQAVVTDAATEADVLRLFETVAVAGYVPQFVACTTGINQPASLLETSTELLENLWRTNCLAGFHVGKEAIRRMLPQGRGTLLLTGATASLRARPPFTAFGVAKAALRALAQGMAREFSPQGIHVAHVVIDGVIDGAWARQRFPDYVASKGAEGLLPPDDIAAVYWQLHQQPRGTWTQELDLRPFGEPF